MSKTAHTPGPCSVVREDCTWTWVILSPDGFRMGYAYGKSNADLWAASPKLLTTCENVLAGLLKEFPDFIDTQDGPYVQQDWVTELRGAIADATAPTA